MIEIRTGDSRKLLEQMPSESVHTVITSPPYYGLRDYEADGQMGQEDTPAEFVAALVDLLREVKRVLRKDGTLWLNIGDSYSSAGRRGDSTSSSSTLQGGHASQKASAISRTRSVKGLRPKNLLGIPWRVAFALQDDGWYLRQDIIWSKPNPMPESVEDRCTKSHEYLFLLSKSEVYYFDHEAIREDRVGDEDANGFRGGAYVDGQTNNGVLGRRKSVGNRKARGVPPRHSSAKNSDQSGLDDVVRGEGRNKRSVWTVATKPYPEAHFATYPPDLIEPCILAGCPKGGTVLDPFGGAGTTGLVADRHGRNAILLEINPKYVAMAKRRIERDSPLYAEVRA